MERIKIIPYGFQNSSRWQGSESPSRYFIMQKH